MVKWVGLKGSTCRAWTARAKQLQDRRKLFRFCGAVAADSVRPGVPGRARAGRLISCRAVR
jgi:hypothetical protein